MAGFMTLAQVAPLAAGANDLGDWIQDLGKDTGEHSLLGILTRFLGHDIGLGFEVWQPVALVALVGLGFLVNAVARLLVRAAAKVVLRRGGASARVGRVAFAVRPLGAVAMGLVWYAAFPLLGFNDTVERVIQGAIHLVLIGAGVWAAFRLIDLAGEVMAAKAAETENKLDDVLVPLLRKGAKITAFLLGLGIGLVSFGGQGLLSTVIGSFAIATVALGFAAKETVENFFGTVTVILDSPFDIGDMVVIDGKVEGVVEELGFRSTRVRTPQNTLVTVPNATLVRANVENIQRRDFRRWKTTLSVACSTPPEKLLAFTEGVRELVRIHPYTRKDLYQVYANEFGASSLDVLLVVFFAVPDSHTELRERERLLVDILRLADRLGVAFAYPTRNIIVQQGAPMAAAEGFPLAVGPHDAKAQMAGIGAAHEVTHGQPWQEHRPEPFVLPQVKSDYPADCGDPAKA